MTVKCNGCGVDVEGAVAQATADNAFAQARAEKKKADELAAQVAELTQKVSAVDDLTAQLEATKSQLGELEGANSKLTLEREFMIAGLTDAEGMDVARMFHEKLPEDSRPPIGEWLSNRDALPKAVQAYLETQQSAPTETAPAPTEAPTEPARAAAINPHNGVVPTSSAPETYPAGSISKMSVDEYRAHRDQIIAAVSSGS